MTHDPFRRLQKSKCPPLRGKRRGNRSVYGCPCCRSMGFNDFKKHWRRWARKVLKEETQEEITAYYIDTDEE